MCLYIDYTRLQTRFLFFLVEATVLFFSEALPNYLNLGTKKWDGTLGPLGRDALASMARFVQVQIENQLNGITIISPCKFRHGGPTARLDGLKSSDVDVDVLGPGNPWGFRFLSFPRCFF